MNAIYLPFTYISKKKAKKFLKIFDKIIIYQAFNYEPALHMRQMAEEKKIAIKIPIQNSPKEMMQMIQEYKNSGIAKNKRDINLIKFYNKPFLFDENSKFKIKEEIQGRKKDHKENANDLLRLFLFLAYDFDKNNDEIKTNLNLLNSKEFKMFQKLKNENDDINSNITKLDDIGLYKYAQRLKAWSYVFLNDKKQDCKYFLTDSKKIMEHILKTNRHIEKTSQIDGIKKKPFLEFYKIKNKFFSIYFPNLPQIQKKDRFLIFFNDILFSS